MFKQFIRAKGARVASALALALSVGPAMAADAIDTTGPVSTITGGLAAVSAIGAAWVGFKYLKKVWNRV